LGGGRGRPRSYEPNMADLIFFSTSFFLGVEIEITMHTAWTMLN
jgi:hypothetical protein